MTQQAAFPQPVLRARFVEGLTWIAVTALGALAMLVLVSTIAVTFDLYSPLPYLDQWATVSEIGKWDAGNFGFSDWWSQHNEHRPLVPRFFLYADYWWFGGRNVFDLVVIHAAQAIHVAILIAVSWFVVRGLPNRLAAFAAAAAVAIAMQYSTAQVENFIIGFQVQWVLGYLFATASFTLMWLAAGRAPPAQWALVTAAIVLAAASQLSFANGLLCWPVLLAIGGWLRMPRAPLALVLAAGLALSILYFIDYSRPPGGPDPVDGLGDPGRFLSFLVLLMGSPFYELLGEGASKVIGVGAIIAFAAVLFDVYSYPGRYRGAPIVFVALLTFALLTAVMVAAARSPLGEIQATAPRYSEGVALFWTAAVILGWAAVASSAPEWPGRFLMWAPAAFLVVTAVFTYNEAVDPWKDVFEDRHDTTDAIRVGVLDPGPLGHIYPPGRVGEILPLLQVLRDGRYSVFHGPNDADLMGTNIGALGAAPAGACMGSFDGTNPVGRPEGEGVNGWAWDSVARRRVARVVLAGPSGTIVGFANGHKTRADVPAAISEVTSNESGWVGYALASTEPVRAFAVLADGVCALEGEHVIPSGRAPSP